MRSIALVLALTVSACSFSAKLITDGPCSNAAPGVDTGVAVVTGILGIMALIDAEGASDTEGGALTKALGTTFGVLFLGIAAGYAGSAAYGFNHASDC